LATAAIMKLVSEIDRLRDKGLKSGQDIGDLQESLDDLATAVRNTSPPDVRPQSRRVTWDARTITANGVSEKVTDRIKMMPLSVVPPAAGGGSGVANSATHYMQMLRKSAGYVRGHMLNMKVHGPGDEDTNLVPISRKFNGEMSSTSGVEYALKQAVNSENKVVSYEVEPQAWGTFRPTGAPYEQQLPGSFKFKIKEMLLTGTMNPANPNDWAATGNDIYDDTVTHAPPRDIAFDEATAPARPLMPGVYQTNRLEDYRPAVTKAQHWIAHGEYEQVLMGKQETRRFDEGGLPVLITPAAGCTAKDHGDHLVIDKPSGSGTELGDSVGEPSRKLEAWAEEVVNEQQESISVYDEARVALQEKESNLVTEMNARKLAKYKDHPASGTQMVNRLEELMEEQRTLQGKTKADGEIPPDCFVSFAKAIRQYEVDLREWRQRLAGLKNLAKTLAIKV
jgi:hypothetical protein